MRIYTASSQEDLRARTLLKAWHDDGLLTKEQNEQLEQETVSDLRTTNIFLRLVLFLFTLICVGAAAGLFSLAFLRLASEETSGIFFLICAAVCYATAETAVSQARLYHYGIEEALACCSVGFLCAGVQSLGGFHVPIWHGLQLVLPTSGAIFSLWIWRRFGLWYAFPAAMIFAIFLAADSTTSHAAQHTILAVFYAAGLIGIAVTRSRHRFDYLAHAYSLVEAFLWLGLYLAINLKLSALFNEPAHWWDSGPRTYSGFSEPFYWITWVLIWCLPPIVLARGVRSKDRFVLAVGAIVSIMTFISNKPYLGWQRHTWDPMLLGIALTGAAVFLRRWLARDPSGVRHGFTAARLSGKDSRWINAGSAVLGLLTQHSITPAPQEHNPEFTFGGGSSGGGGVSGDF